MKYSYVILICCTCLTLGYLWGGYTDGSLTQPTIEPIEQYKLSGFGDTLPSGMNELVVKDLTFKVERLTHKISQLENKLLSLKQKSISEEATVSTVTTNIISREEAELDTQLPFSNFLVDKGGVIADLFKTLNGGISNNDHSMDRENNIQDSINLNDPAGGISLDSVRCHSTVCEIRGFESDEGQWTNVSKKMQQEKWWSANAVYFDGGHSNQHGYYFYAIVNFN